MKEQMNVPTLRFSEFHNQWLVHKLHSIANINDGTHQTPNYVKKGVQFVSVENIKDLKRTSKFITPEAYEKGFKIKPQIGDILMTRITAGVIGATAIVTDNEPLAYYVSLALIRETKGNSIPYLAQRIESTLFKRELYKRTIHVAFPKKINLSDIGECLVSLPSYPEQQKIAAFLSKVDEKISLLSEKKAKLTEYKKGVMQQLFNSKWQQQDGKLVFIPPTLRFKADDGSEFPDWEEKRLGSLADLTSSKRVYFSDYSEDGVPFFRGKEISEIRKGIIPDDVLYITRKAFEEFKSKYGAPVEGDILVTAVGTLANILRVTGEFEFYFKDGNLIWLRNPKCDSKFLSILMEANKHELLKTAIGSSQKALTIVELKKIVFKMPSLEEQQKITMFLSSIEEKVRLDNFELEKAKEWKKGLLQQMFV